jgi:hypothetical protein
VAPYRIPNQPAQLVPPIWGACLGLALASVTGWRRPFCPDLDPNRTPGWQHPGWVIRGRGPRYQGSGARCRRSGNR